MVIVLNCMFLFFFFFFSLFVFGGKRSFLIAFTTTVLFTDQALQSAYYLKSVIKTHIHMTIGPYYKSKPEKSRTRVKFCQLIASLSVILLQLKPTKLKLEILKSGFQRKKEKYEHR